MKLLERKKNEALIQNILLKAPAAFNNPGNL